jgi:hypothetical protein
MAIHVSECVLLSHQISITRLIPPSGWTGTITGKMKSMPGLRTRYMVELDPEFRTEAGGTEVDALAEEMEPHVNE